LRYFIFSQDYSARCSRPKNRQIRKSVLRLPLKFPALTLKKEQAKIRLL